MGYKMVCLTCRKAFSTATDNQHMPSVCPECGNGFVLYNHKFAPPKRNDLKAWKVITFLYQNGFNYQHIYKTPRVHRHESNENYVEYPQTLDEAKEFVIKYKSQAKKPNPIV
jgi:DNA-directed RNA polymerase subunit RPC12/RpoP